MLGKTVGKFTKFKVTNCGSKVKWSNSCFEILKKGFGYFLKMNSKRVTNFKFTICSSKVKWSSFSFNFLIKGFEIHFIKVANIKVLLMDPFFLWCYEVWALIVCIQKNCMCHILLVLIIPTQCCYASLFVCIDNTNVLACWNQLIACKSLSLDI